MGKKVTRLELDFTAFDYLASRERYLDEQLAALGNIGKLVDEDKDRQQRLLMRIWLTWLLKTKRQLKHYENANCDTASFPLKTLLASKRFSVMDRSFAADEFPMRSKLYMLLVDLETLYWLNQLKPKDWADDINSENFSEWVKDFEEYFLDEPSKGNLYRHARRPRVTDFRDLLRLNKGPEKIFNSLQLVRKRCNVSYLLDQISSLETSISAKLSAPELVTAMDSYRSALDDSSDASLDEQILRFGPNGLQKSGERGWDSSESASQNGRVPASSDLSEGSLSTNSPAADDDSQPVSFKELGSHDNARKPARKLRRGDQKSSDESGKDTESRKEQKTKRRKLNQEPVEKAKRESVRGTHRSKVKGGGAINTAEGVDIGNAEKSAGKRRKDRFYEDDTQSGSGEDRRRSARILKRSQEGDPIDRALKVSEVTRKDQKNASEKSSSGQDYSQREAGSSSTGDSLPEDDYLKSLPRKPMPDNKDFTLAEDRILVRGMRTLGFGKWKEILALGGFKPIRTTLSLKDRARTLKMTRNYFESS